MSAKRTTAVVMAKMALSDGTVTDEEREFLAPMLGEGETIDELLEEARGRSLGKLVTSVESYADRFFIAMRAARMALADRDLDAREEALYDDLVDALDIALDDREVIKRSIESLRAMLPVPIDPRVEELFEQSSFTDEALARR